MRITASFVCVDEVLLRELKPRTSKVAHWFTNLIKTHKQQLCHVAPLDRGNREKITVIAEFLATQRNVAEHQLWYANSFTARVSHLGRAHFSRVKLMPIQRMTYSIGQGVAKLR